MKGRPDCIEEEDATDDDAILQHDVVVIAPLTGRARDGCALEDQRGHLGAGGGGDGLGGSGGGGFGLGPAVFT